LGWIFPKIKFVALVVNGIRRRWNRSWLLWKLQLV
jgi:hypothetical protein